MRAPRTNLSNATDDERAAHYNAYQRTRYALNIEKARAYNRAWTKANPDKCKKRDRKRNLKKNYGLTPEEFDALLAAQGGCCGICSTNTPHAHNGWCVDHDHKTGQVRGILCTNCNAAGGMLGDDPALLRKAADWFSLL